ncbi:DMT family transporter [Aquabacterium sp. A7-Y]|uniref:DMT family transporter n=1 Tax=Aquabacterium sp. A7-Y TaxID=1349605 RepID=UPI00223DED24|nr:DMT family transporter [Aquabacterium sp. A7-Y]MCW7541668.1 DMT family transporter [Aquabacterium sp. A7-Y]
MSSTLAPADSALPSLRPASNRLREAVLVFITMIWGGTFLIVQTGLQWSGPFGFVGLRFGIAALLVAVVLRRRLAGLTRREVQAGAWIGVAAFFGYTLQTVGLQGISSSKSAFLTALYVPMVPLLQWLFLRRPPRPAALAAVVLAFVGTVLLSNPLGLDLGFGWHDALTVGCALAVAVEIVLISRYAEGCDAARLAFVQLLVVALLCAPVAWWRQEGLPEATPAFLACVLSMACASAFIQFAMNWAQQTVSATRATLIYAMEPVWAGIVGRLAGERLGPLGLIGGALIVASVVLSELRWPRRAGRD